MSDTDPSELRITIEALVADVETTPTAITLDLVEPLLERAEALAATDIEGAGDLVISAQWLRACAALHGDKYERDFAVLLEAAAALRDLGKPERGARVLTWAAGRAGVASDRDAALQAFGNARQLARIAGDVLLVAQCDDGMASVQWELGRLDLAEKHLRAALAVRQVTSDEAATAYARYRLGWCLAADQYTQERGDEALELLGKARNAAKENDEASLAAHCDEKAAWVLAARGDMDRAISVLRTVIDVFDALGDEHSLLVARTHLARHLMDGRQKDEAEFLLRTATEATGDDTRHVRLSAASRLAKLLCRTGRADEALRLLDDVAGDVDADDRIEAPQYHLARAAVFQALATRQAMKEAAQTALDLLDRAVLPALHAEALEYLAWVAEAEGQRTEAQALYAQAMALYLLSDGQGEAMRLASAVVPEPPQRNSGVAGAGQSPLATGLYL